MMKDIISANEYKHPLFSIDRYDRNGGVTDKGIYLHYGDVAIMVARTLRGFRAHIKHLETMADEIELMLKFN
jgi:hypothetical protein